MKNFSKYFFYILIFAVLGFSREYLFVNINNQLYSLYYHQSNYILPNSLFFLKQISYQNLYFLKYPLTTIYFIAYLITSYFATVKINGNKKNGIWVVYIYALLLALSGVSMIYNYIINNQLQGDQYTFSRWLMGIGQSPLIAFFIIASNTLNFKIENNTKI